MFSKLTIGSLLTRMNLLSLAVSLSLGGAFLFSITMMGNSINEIGNIRLPGVIELRDIDTNVSNLVQLEARGLLSDNPAHRAQYASQSAELRKGVPGSFQRYTQYFHDEQDRVLLDRAMSLWTTLDQHLDETHAKEATGDFVAARKYFDNVVVPDATAFGEAIDKTAEDVESDATAAVSAGTANSRVGMIMAIVATILGVASSIIVLLLSRKRVLLPLSLLDGGLARMAGGDFSTAIPGAGQADEIGAIARSVDRIKQRVADKAEQENAIQTRVVESLGEALQALAAGQMTHRISAAFPPQYETLRSIFNSAVADLDDLIGEVAGTTTAVGYASNELSSASLDLAKRTEAQAARLESTSNAIVNLTATVRETARGALDVKSGADLAQTQASAGAAVANDAMIAMGGIAESSSRISQITDMIDSIAFQTNLLALNAGVEAARAGDAGKGFAVVANEVRALAQRSTEAARSIKELIATSSTQVDLGVKLVSSSGEALVGIVGKVTELKTLIEGISDATNGQAGDLEGLSSSIREMEVMTQQNAAMVEEVSGAARNLQEESVKMTGLVQRFAASEGNIAAMPARVPLASPPARIQPASAPRISRTGASRSAVASNLALQPSTDDWSEF